MNVFVYYGDCVFVFFQQVYLCGFLCFFCKMDEYLVVFVYQVKLFGIGCIEEVQFVIEINVVIVFEIIKYVMVQQQVDEFVDGRFGCVDFGCDFIWLYGLVFYVQKFQDFESMIQFLCVLCCGICGSFRYSLFYLVGVVLVFGYKWFCGWNCI